VSFKVGIEQRLSQDSHGGHRHSFLAYSPHQWLTYSQPVQSAVQEDSILWRQNEHYVHMVLEAVMLLCVYCYMKILPLRDHLSECVFTCT